MRLMQRAPDGGKDSGVDGFFVIEIKHLFSIVLLRFRPGSKRENLHSHAFHAITIWLKGKADEMRVDLSGDKLRYRMSTWTGGRIKFTPRSNMHRIMPVRTTYALCLRGPWHSTWQEYAPATDQIITLTHGRREIGRVPGCWARPGCTTMPLRKEYPGGTE